MAIRLLSALPDLSALTDRLAAAEARAEKAEADAAKAEATGQNARQMVLNRDPRLTAVEELAAFVDQAIAAGAEDHATIWAALEAQRVSGGSVAVPSLLLGQTRDLTITLNHERASDDYRVTILPGALLGRATFTVKARTTATVTLTATAVLAVTAGQSVAVVCS